MNSIKNYINNINSIEKLNEFKSNVDKLINDRESKLNSINEANSLNNMSFSFIKESFENLSPKLYETENGKKIIGKYINEHKKNKDLKSMYAIHENIILADKNVDVEAYINDLKSFSSKINEEKLNEGIKSLSNILKEAYIEVGADAKALIAHDNKSDLNESIKFVFTNDKNIKNINRYSLCINEIKRFVNNNEGKQLTFEKKNFDTNNLIKEFNRKYNNKNLTKEEIKSLKEFAFDSSKEKVFENYKNKCLFAINEAIESTNDQVETDRLQIIKSKIESKSFCNETFKEDITNLDDLTRTLKD